MQHLGYLRIANFAMAGFSALGTVGVLALGALALVALMGSGADTMTIVTGVLPYGIMTIVLLGLAAAYAVTGVLVAKGRGRILQTLVALPVIENIPVGTAYGAYALWVCWGNEETKEAFARGGA